MYQGALSREGFVFQVNFFLLRISLCCVKTPHTPQQVEIFGKKANAKTLSVYYSKLHGYYSAAQKDVLRSKIELENQKYDDLSEQYAAKKAVLERLKILEEKRKEIQAAVDARTAAEKRCVPHPLPSPPSPPFFPLPHFGLLGSLTMPTPCTRKAYSSYKFIQTVLYPLF